VPRSLDGGGDRLAEIGLSPATAAFFDAAT
jgi:hypothetical protein